MCGRTLLRGERAHAYLDGGMRRSVCELCTSRAVHEGWVREGTELPYDPSRSASDRRRSLLGRLRGRRGERARPAPLPEEPAPDFDEYEAAEELDYGYDYEQELPPRPSPPPVRAYREPVREPRHVRAIPTSAEQKYAAAIEVFNGSEHRRTVAGVARSLGLPTVAVLDVGRPGQVAIIASWELCWYRYEVDLSEDTPDARVTAQGYELDELEAAERQPNAVADDSGALSLAG